LKCTWKHALGRLCAGPVVSDTSPPGSAFTPRTPTSGRPKPSGLCCARPALELRSTGPTSRAGSVCSGRRSKTAETVLLNGSAGRRVGHAAKTRHGVVALGGEVVAVARVPHARRCGRAGAFEYRAAIEPGQRVIAVRMGFEAGEGGKGTRRPLPNRAPDEARQAVRRSFPLGLSRQPAAGPAAPGLRFKGGQVAGAGVQIQRLPLPEAAGFPAM